MYYGSVPEWSVFRGSPEAEALRRASEASLARLPQLRTVVREWLRQLCLDAGADDVGLVAIDTAPHLQAWRQCQQRASDTGRSGVFHETFLVRAGAYEAVYDNMPPTGLGAFATLQPLPKSSGARSRLGPDLLETIA